MSDYNMFIINNVGHNMTPFMVNIHAFASIWNIIRVFVIFCIMILNTYFPYCGLVLDSLLPRFLKANVAFKQYVGNTITNIQVHFISQCKYNYF